MASLATLSSGTCLAHIVAHLKTYHLAVASPKHNLHAGKLVPCCMPDVLSAGVEEQQTGTISPAQHPTADINSHGPFATTSSCGVMVQEQLRSGEDLEAFLASLANDTNRGRPDGGHGPERFGFERIRRCGICTACRQPWLDRPCRSPRLVLLHGETQLPSLGTEQTGEQVVDAHGVTSTELADTMAGKGGRAFGRSSSDAANRILERAKAQQRAAREKARPATLAHKRPASLVALQFRLKDHDVHNPLTASSRSSSLQVSKVPLPRVL